MLRYKKAELYLIKFNYWHVNINNITANIYYFIKQPFFINLKLLLLMQNTTYLHFKDVHKFKCIT